MKRKRWVAIRIEESVLEKLTELDPYARDRTERIVRRLKKGGRPLF